VARVAVEVVDGWWWKHQLRVKSADSRTTALSSNEGASGQPLFTVASFCVNLSIQSEPFYFSLSNSSRHDSEKLRKGWPARVYDLHSCQGSPFIRYSLAPQSDPAQYLKTSHSDREAQVKVARVEMRRRRW
jgi:hypothetical protein